MYSRLLAPRLGRLPAQQRGRRSLCGIVECAIAFLRGLQVITNVLGNAIKFSDAGGKAGPATVIHATALWWGAESRGGGGWNSSLLTRVPRQVSLTLEPTSDGTTARICIVDSGIGLSAAGLERLFKPFSQASCSPHWMTSAGLLSGSLPRRSMLPRPWQAEDSTWSRFGGSGLGLLISRNICRAMQGDLSISSDGLGCGSTVTIALPLLPSAQPRGGYGADLASHAEGSDAPRPLLSSGTTGARSQTSGPSLWSKRVRLLLAEDSAALRKVLMKQLVAVGVEAGCVEAFEHGALLYAEAERSPIDVGMVLMVRSSCCALLHPHAAEGSPTALVYFGHPVNAQCDFGHNARTPIWVVATRMALQRSAA